MVQYLESNTLDTSTAEGLRIYQDAETKVNEASRTYKGQVLPLDSAAFCEEECKGWEAGKPTCQCGSTQPRWGFVVEAGVPRATVSTK